MFDGGLARTCSVGWIPTVDILVERAFTLYSCWLYLSSDYTGKGDERWSSRN